MTIKELLVKLTVRADAKAIDNVSKRLDMLTRAFKIFIGIKVASYFYGLAQSFGKTGQHITVLASAAGLGVEQYQKLAYAAQQNGITHEKFSVGLTRMNHQMERAKNGAVTAIGVFTRAGIKPEQIKSWHSSSDALYALQDAFSKMTGPDSQARKLAVVTELFGRGAHNFLLYMDQGSAAAKKLERDALRAGAVISARNVNELNKTKQAWTSFSETIKAQTSTIFAAFSPIFRALVRKMQAAIGSSASMIDSTAKSWANQFAYSIGYIAGTIARFVKFFTDHSKGISEALFNVVNFIAASIRTLLSSGPAREVSAAFQQMWDAVSGKHFDDEKFQKGFWSLLVGVVKVVGLAILQIITFVVQRLGAAIQYLWTELKASAKKEWPEAYEFIKTALNDITKLISTFTENVGSFFTSVKTWIKEVYDSAVSKYNSFADVLGMLGVKKIAVTSEGEPITTRAAMPWQAVPQKATNEDINAAQGAGVGMSYFINFLRSFSAARLVDTMQGAQVPMPSPAPGPQSSVMEQTKDAQSRSQPYYNIVVPINIQQPIGTDERKIAELTTSAIRDYFLNELKDTHLRVAPKAAT